MKLSRVEYEVPVDVTSEKAWSILARFVDVGEFHSGVLKSKIIGEKSSGAGASRCCELPKNVTVYERILEWNDGQSYTYDVYEWKNFPLKKMLTTFGVQSKLPQRRTIVRQVVDYRLSPGFLTPIMKGTLRKAVRDTLLGYKHFMETGEANVDLRKLRESYRHV